MSAKLILYIVSSVIVMFSIDSVNISVIFKRNKELQAKLFYFIITLCLIELLTEFLYNIFELVNIF